MGHSEVQIQKSVSRVVTISVHMTSFTVGINYSHLPEVGAPKVSGIFSMELLISGGFSRKQSSPEGISNLSASSNFLMVDACSGYGGEGGRRLKNGRVRRGGSELLADVLTRRVSGGEAVLTADGRQMS